MSPIGKAFLVINLVLAGIFVGFAGTYLQKAADWKQQHEDLKESTDVAATEASQRYEALRNDHADVQRRHLQAERRPAG